MGYPLYGTGFISIEFVSSFICFSREHNKRLHRDICSVIEIPIRIRTLSFLLRHFSNHKAEYGKLQKKIEMKGLCWTDVYCPTSFFFIIPLSRGVFSLLMLFSGCVGGCACSSYTPKPKWEFDAKYCGVHQNTFITHGYSTTTSKPKSLLDDTLHTKNAN